MRQIEVSFPSGKEVLDAYWGFLSNGGLVIRHREELAEGEAVALEVVIQSSQRRYKLNGQVVRRPDLEAPSRDRVVIAFHPGEPHDLLLSAAWAETDNVPARRHRRFPLDASIRFRDDRGHEHEHRGRLLNLSFGGCCLRADARATKELASGDRIVLLGDAGVEVPGVVRWARAADVGIEFDGQTTPAGALDTFVRKFL